MPDNACPPTSIKVESCLPEKWDEEYDVVVIGAGLAGLSAAIEAKDAGADVILLEKMSSVTSSHSTRNVGNVAGAGSKMQAAAGIQDSPELWREDLLAQGEPRLMPLRLLDILINSGASHVDWLQDMGVPFSYLCKRSPDSLPRGHIIEGDARPIGIALSQRLQERGVKILLETRALELYRLADNHVAGVKAESKEKTINFKAKKAVILSAGDYSASKELKARFTSAQENIIAETAGNPGNTGDGFRMAWALGADSTCLDDVGDTRELFMFPDQPRGTGISEYLIDAGAIIVNKDGKRFQNESATVGGKIVYKQPGQVAFVIFDTRIATTDVVPEGAPTGRGPWICTCRYLDDWRKFPGAVKEANTIEELAEKLGVNPSGLAETVKKYNRCADARKDADFGRTYFGPGIRKPPFIGLGPGRPMVFTCNGTLMVNEKHRVLDVFGRVIPGLYAAGDMGKSGKIVGHGTRLAWACVSGRRSGKFAAAETTRV
ncbi:MAG: FAD-dependent oxidoreductase [Chloroflexi bacterium]|nr:FAD-dependent oxidoreductase [Chloroflexota bacterium]